MFGARLKELRIEKSITQSELAKLLSISASTVGMYEQGRRDPDTSTLQFLAEYFDCSVDYLLGRTNKRKYDIDTLAFSTKLDVEGLSDEDLEAVQNIIDALKNKNK